jgi:hypothetical protein
MSGSARNFRLAVIRLLTILSAAALALLVPVVAPAAPSGGLRVYHPVLRTSGSMPVSSSRVGTGAPGPFKVPFDLNVRPRSQEPDAQTTWAPFRWQAWHPILGSLLYRPVWYQAGCFANGGLAEPQAPLSTPNGTSAPTSFTFGSLAGHRSSTLFGSSVSDVARVASAKDAAAAASPLTLQYGVSATPCGSTNAFSF